MEVDVGRVDWDLLRKQKETLANLVFSKDHCISSHDQECIEGVMCLLDEIQDSAAKVLGDETVFGPDPEETKIPA